MDAMELAILIALCCVATYALIAQRLSRTILTAPMMFLSLGYGLSMLDLIHLQEGRELLHLVAEITLIIVLFADASSINLRELERFHIWPQRMLLVGLPAAIAIGTLVAAFFFPSWPLFAIALIAAILAPTDAALGQAVVNNKNVPATERRSLVVESGLNDGLALPAILFFAYALAIIDGEQNNNFVIFTLQQLIFGPLIGVIIGWLGGKLTLFADQHALTNPQYEGIAAIAIAMIAYVAAGTIDGNGYIAVFVAGLIFGNTVKGKNRNVQGFLESEGQLLIWVSFFLIGLLLMPFAIEGLTRPILLFILSCLFIVRPLAIYLSLIGTGATLRTRLFFGWFGPRGLATALFALLVVGDIDQMYAASILVIAVNTVWISVVLHGITAAPGAAWYAQYSHTLKTKRAGK